MSAEQGPQPQDQPTRSVRRSLFKRIVATQGAVPMLLTVSALAVVLLLAAIRPAQRQGVPQVGTVPHPTRSVTASSTPSVTLTPSATSTPSSTPTSTATPLPPILYDVVSGDSVAAIAEQFGVSMESIIAANGLDQAGTMYPGDKLKIPHPTATAGPTTPTATVQASGSAAGGASTASVKPSSPAPTASPQPLTHPLAEGETLAAVAAQYGVTVDALVQANQIADPSKLLVGQKLVIPGKLVTATPAPTSAMTRTPTSGPLLPAPRLLWPADAAPFKGDDAVIVLEWASVGLLADDAWYELSLMDPSGVVTTVRTKANSWRVPAEMRPFPDAGAHTFAWHVDVVRGQQELGNSIPIGASGATRKFRWD
jgi:LysM repeat protein